MSAESSRQVDQANKQERIIGANKKGKGGNANASKPCMYCVTSSIGYLSFQYN